MTQKKNAPTAQGNESAIKNSANSTGSTTIKLTPRQHRALVALVERGAVPCKELGILAGQNNFAELVAGLRRKLGVDAIATGSFDSLDRDGKPCKPGFYELTPQGRAQVAELMKEAI